MTVLKLTVRRGTERKRRASVTLEGTLYTFVYQYVSYTDSWILDILDDADVALLSGIHLMQGIDLLEGHHHLEVPPGKLVVYDTSNTEVEAGLDDFDERVVLAYEESA